MQHWALCCTRPKRRQHKISHEKLLRASRRTRGHVRPFALIHRICVHGQIDINTTDVRDPLEGSDSLLLITQHFSAACKKSWENLETTGALKRCVFRATIGCRGSQGASQNSGVLDKRTGSWRCGFCTSTWPVGTSAAITSTQNAVDTGQNFRVYQDARSKHFPLREA